MKHLTVKLVSIALSLTLLAACASTKPTGASSTPVAVPTNRLEKIKAAGKLVLATSPDYAPYEFQDISKTGQEAIVGADIELAKYIAAGLGVELVIEPMSFETVVTSVSEGKADIAISGLAPKPERAIAIDFSTPFNKGAGYQGVLILAKDKEKYKTVGDLKGKKIAVQNGSLQSDLTSAQVENPQLEFITSLNDGIMMLQTGKVSALSVPSVTGLQFVQNYPELFMSEMKYEYESAGTIAGIKKGETQLLAAVNKLIEEAEASGKYQNWVQEGLTLSNKLTIKK